jgi:RadC-like JAB domain
MSLNPTRSIAHPREIFKPVITHSAYSFIMVHNHPSGAVPYPVLCRTECRVSSDEAFADAA